MMAERAFSDLIVSLGTLERRQSLEHLVASAACREESFDRIGAIFRVRLRRIEMPEPQPDLAARAAFGLVSEQSVRSPGLELSQERDDAVRRDRSARAVTHRAIVFIGEV